jgi:hypothetical protein
MAKKTAKKKAVVKKLPAEKKPAAKKDLHYDKDAYQDQAWERGEAIECAVDESEYSDEE